VESIIERIERGNFWDFHGGIHPPQQKFLTQDKPIRQLTLPKQLVIPIQQNIGQAGEIIVTVGQQVLKGQPLTKAVNPMSVPVHAPTSGKVTSIRNAVTAHPSGLSELCVFLLPDGEDRWRERELCADHKLLSKTTIIQKIANAGIAGMGGAGFPTHIKAHTKRAVNYLIINAVECEPYITADDLLMTEHSASILEGIDILDHLLEPAFILIGIEDNKPQAIKALQQACKGNERIKICILPTKYPTGGEKQLIMALTGQEVPAGVLPNSLGIVMQNVATCFAIAEAVIHDKPLIKRVVTVTGKALTKPQNVWCLLGTEVDFLLNQCGYQQATKKRIIMGGPMMGFSLPNTQVPIVKISNCILAPSDSEIAKQQKEIECIRCGQCADVCPSQLLPQELQWSAKAKDHHQLEKLNLFDCIECGACAYVCPSHIPLVHYYRIAKAEIRHQHVLDIKAEKAKERFEARKLRLERDKKARDAKTKKAAEARKARMNAGTTSGNSEKSAVAAALARVKAKKAKNQDVAQQAPTKANPLLEDTSEKSQQKSQVLAAIARAKAKKLQAQKELPSQSKETEITNASVVLKIENNDNGKINIDELATDSANDSLQDQQTSRDTIQNNIQNDIQDNSQKSKVSAAIARAKAKKLAGQQRDKNNKTLTTETSIEQTNQAPSNITVNDKKARIAAAIAKAKAKKQHAESK
jgi:electron transport complex protein RnfC